MVERGEELLNNTHSNRFYKSLISRTIKMVIKQSKKLGLRTEQDWIDYRNMQTDIKVDADLDCALSEENTIPKNTQ